MGIDQIGLGKYYGCERTRRAASQLRVGGWDVAFANRGECAEAEPHSISLQPGWPL
jgi:hypothetical protein